MNRRERRKRAALHALVVLADEQPLEYEQLVDGGDLRDDMVTLVDIVSTQGDVDV